MIEWKDGAVCFAGGKQWMALNGDSECLVWHVKAKHSFRSGFELFEDISKHKDFQLNEIREGDYIEASELDTEQKYNDAVAVFRLFGVTGGVKVGGYALIHGMPSWGVKPTFVVHDVLSELCLGFITSSLEYFCTGKKLTYPQLMAIGKLKRAMVERDEAERAMSKCTCKQCMRGLENYCMAELKTPPLDVSGFNTVEQSREKCDRRNKSKQAYTILESLDYEYDLVKQRWYKKEWV